MAEPATGSDSKPAGPESLCEPPLGKATIMDLWINIFFHIHSLLQLHLIVSIR